MGTGLIMNNQGVHHEVKRSSSDNRRSNKPIMEKRRRARINNCLNDLKVLILDATKKDPARHSKLEKADILEKTVRYLTDMQRQQLHMAQAANPAAVDKYIAGFTECAKEVDRFQGMDPVIKRRLLQHLTSCIKTNDTSAANPTSTGNTSNEHRLPTSPPSSPDSKIPTISHPVQQQQQYQHSMSAAEVQQQAQTQYLSQAMVKPMVAAAAASATNANAYYFNYPAAQHVQQHMHIQQQHQQQQQSHHLTHQQMPSLVPIPNRAAHTVSPHSSNSTVAYPSHPLQSSAPTPPSSVSSPVCSTQYLPLSPVSFEFQHAKRSDSASRDVDDDEEDDDDEEEEVDEDDEQDADVDDEEELTVDVDDEYLRQPATRRRRLNCGASSAVSSASSQVSQSSSSGSSVSSADEDDQRSTCSTNSGPLSLVMKRSAAAMDEDEERPWRPW